MSTDSTELTFVRCPSCRSLVPAVSTRCRMCGATLDSSQKPAEPEDEQKKSGRVRQRTMSQPENELSSTAEKIREDIEKEPDEEPEKPAAAPTYLNKHETEIDSSADPLSAYIEEVADVIPAAAKPEVTPAAVVEETPFEEEMPEPQAQQEKPQMRDRQDFSRKPMEPQAPKDDAKARVIVESGPRRFAKGPGLSFGKKPEEESSRNGGGLKQDRKDRQSEKPVRDEQHGDGGRHAQQQQQPRRDQQRPQRPDNQREDQKFRDRNEQRERPVNEPRERKIENQAPQRVEPVKEQQPPPQVQQHPGRLSGWLVSYVNPDGVATELREGKFFVSRSGLKPSDMILDDASISTPHSLVSVSASEGLKVQDLMSERGVFLRRRGADAYQKIVDTVKVEHGDWLRFGDIEFLVSLVAHPGAK